MGYFILVILQTIGLPVISGGIELALIGGDPVLVFGKWWAFWGAGTRLLVAGLAQVSGKGPTSEILGSSAPSAQEKQLVRELGTANIGMGLAGLLALVPGWVVPAGSRAACSCSSPGSCTFRKRARTHRRRSRRGPICWSERWSSRSRCTCS